MHLLEMRKHFHNKSKIWILFSQTQKMSAQCFSKYNLQKIQKLQERSTNKMDDDVFALQRKKTHHFAYSKRHEIMRSKFHASKVY